MKYRIKHETYAVLIIALIATLFFFAAVLLLDIDIRSWVIKADVAILILSILFFIVEKIMGTYIIVGDRTVTIRRLTGWKTLHYEEIGGISVEQYERYRRKPVPHTDHRMRMNISIITGRDIKLTDDAGTLDGFFGFITGVRDRRLDEEVPLYKAYMDIKPRINAGRSSAF